MLLSDILIFPIIYLIARKYGIIDKYPKTRCVEIRYFIIFCICRPPARYLMYQVLDDQHDVLVRLRGSADEAAGLLQPGPRPGLPGLAVPRPGPRGESLQVRPREEAAVRQNLHQTGGH